MREAAWDERNFCSHSNHHHEHSGVSAYPSLCKHDVIHGSPVLSSHHDNIGPLVHASLTQHHDNPTSHSLKRSDNVPLAGLEPHTMSSSLHSSTASSHLATMFGDVVQGMDGSLDSDSGEQVDTGARSEPLSSDAREALTSGGVLSRWALVEMQRALSVSSQVANDTLADSRARVGALGKPSPITTTPVVLTGGTLPEDDLPFSPNHSNRFNVGLSRSRARGGLAFVAAGSTQTSSLHTCVSASGKRCGPECMGACTLCGRSQAAADLSAILVPQVQQVDARMSPTSRCLQQAISTRVHDAAVARSGGSGSSIAAGASMSASSRPRHTGPLFRRVHSLRTAATKDPRSLPDPRDTAHQHQVWDGTFLATNRSQKASLGSQSHSLAGTKLTQLQHFDFVPGAVTPRTLSTQAPILQPANAGAITSLRRSNMSSLWCCTSGVPEGPVLFDELSALPEPDEPAQPHSIPLIFHSKVAPWTPPTARPLESPAVASGSSNSFLITPNGGGSHMPLFLSPPSRKTRPFSRAESPRTLPSTHNEAHHVMGLYARTLHAGEWLSKRFGPVPVYYFHHDKCHWGIFKHKHFLPGNNQLMDDLEQTERPTCADDLLPQS